MPTVEAVGCEAARLTELIAPGEPVTFLTFGEGSAKGERRLTKTLHGTFAERGQLLTDLNDCGAGVFWMVNAGDGKGRKASNVTHVRALFVDLDGSPLQPVTEAPLQPHIIVESSPGRWHAYWRIADCPLTQFSAYQKALAIHFDADKKVCDLPRVLRLPGFLHQKAEPFRSHIVACNNVAPYVLDDFNGAFNFAPYTEAQRRRGADTQAIQATQAIRAIQVRGGTPETEAINVAKFIPDAPGQRQRNHCLFALARHLKAHMPNATRAELRAQVKQWHELALPFIGTVDFNESWGDFSRGWENVQHPEGELMNVLLKNVDADRLPDGLPGDYEAPTLRLVRICARLQREAQSEPFYLSARTAGELLGMHFTSAANLLYALVADGVITRVSQGTHKNRQASEYRMVTP